jgi:hypothetical protein
MREHYDGRGFRKSGQVLFQAGDLLRADRGPSARDIVQSDKMHPAIIKGIMGFGEGFSKRDASVKRGIVFSRDVFDVLHFQTSNDLPEVLHYFA